MTRATAGDREEIRAAIARDEFQVHYQPKLHLRSGLMTRAEALIRWNHPRRGLILPAEFIPAAERSGTIGPLTDWLMDHVMEQLVEWHATGAPVHVAINASAVNVLDHSLPGRMQRYLDKWSLDPRFVKLEITEAAMVSDPSNTLGVLGMLEAIGVRLALDDFGIGYSSLTHLRQLPIDEIKIDQSLIRGMRDNDDDAAMVRTIVEIGRNLGKQICAEGVETEGTWRRLLEMQCDLAQGYWISKPVPAAEFLAWLVESSWGMKTAASVQGARTMS